VACSPVAQWRQGVAGEHRWGPGEAPGKKSGDGAHRGGRATVGRREVAGAVAFNDGRVAPVVVDEGGWVLQLEGDLGVRRRWSIEGKSSSEGRSPEGVDGSDAWTESGAEEGLWRWKTSEADGWVMGKRVRRSGVDGRDKRRAEEKKSDGGSVLRAVWDSGEGGPVAGTPHGVGRMGPGSERQATSRPRCASVSAVAHRRG
jgi:hypothetical protein